MSGQIMFFIDFDGTISSIDVCAAMVEKFARPGWQEINRLWEEGVLSTEECALRTLELMDVEPVELAAFFRTIEIDPSFLPFIDWAGSKDRQYPIYILSDGYDNYIQIILNRYGIKLPYFSNHLEYVPGWRFSCRHSDPECRKCGVCKTGLIKKLIQPGYISVYIGDGYSDLCPAEYCEVVFAKKNLACLCEEKGIPFFLYDDFLDIQRIVENLAVSEQG